MLRVADTGACPLGMRHTHLSERLARLSERFTRLSERFTRLSERFTHLSERFRQQGKSMAKVNKNNNLAIEISARLGI